MFPVPRFLQKRFVWSPSNRRPHTHYRNYLNLNPNKYDSSLNRCFAYEGGGVGAGVGGGVGAGAGAGVGVGAGGGAGSGGGGGVGAGEAVAAGADTDALTDANTDTGAHIDTGAHTGADVGAYQCSLEAAEDLDLVYYSKDEGITNGISAPIDLTQYDWLITADPR
jgi:hypothetical protein